MRQEPRDLKSKVIYILERHESARNSDIALMIELWKEFFTDHINTEHIGSKYRQYVDLDSLYFLPREDNIKRVRATIQNHKTNPQFLPTDPDVRKKRGILEEVWRRYVGANPESKEIKADCPAPKQEGLGLRLGTIIN